MRPTYQSSAPTLVNGQEGGGVLDVNGNLKVAVSGTATTSATVTRLPTSSSAFTSVASSATAVTILAANANRKGASISNTSTAILYLLLATGTATATTSHTVQLASNTYYEVPFGYTGIITGIWASANGSANVTEFT